MNRIHFVLVATLITLAVAHAPATAQTISWVLLANEVGSGLQTSGARARLSDSQHGGVTVRIESADSTLALVTADDQVPGTPYIDVFVANGQTDAFFYVQALEDTTGVAYLNATAPGFAAGLDSIDVVQPTMKLNGLNFSHDPFDIDDTFFVTVGVANGSNTNVTAQESAGRRSRTNSDVYKLECGRGAAGNDGVN